MTLGKGKGSDGGDAKSKEDIFRTTYSRPSHQQTIMSKRFPAAFMFFFHEDGRRAWSARRSFVRARKGDFLRLDKNKMVTIRGLTIITRWRRQSRTGPYGLRKQKRRAKCSPRMLPLCSRLERGHRFAELQFSPRCAKVPFLQNYAVLDA